MKIIEKAVAAVIRTNRAFPELLVFQHPMAGIQIPKGTVEPDETIQSATLRELFEESGIKLIDTPELIGTWQRIVGGDPNETGSLERHVWHISVLDAPAGLPEIWQHEAQGGEAEIGLTFSYFWVRIDATLPAQLSPLFKQTAALIVDHVRCS